MAHEIRTQRLQPYTVTTSENGKIQYSPVLNHYFVIIKDLKSPYSSCKSFEDFKEAELYLKQREKEIQENNEYQAYWFQKI